MIIVLQFMLLLACFVILGFQLVLLRQIGLIHTRLRTLDDPNEKPTKTDIRSLVTLDGSEWTLLESSRTFCVLLSATCNHCRPILDNFPQAILEPTVFIGLSATKADALQVCEKYDLPTGKVFVVNELQNELNLNEFPGYVILDGDGKVLARHAIFALKHLETAISNYEKDYLAEATTN